jgi:hypothetical protein
VAVFGIGVNTHTARIIEDALQAFIGAPITEDSLNEMRKALERAGVSVASIEWGKNTGTVVVSVWQDGELLRYFVMFGAEDEET